MFEIPIITPLFGYVFNFLYDFSHNYLLTLFLFAVIMKVVLLPFGIKQQKNSIKQAKLRPKEMAIRNKYKGRTDKATQQKMQEEIMKLYQEENVNPMSGCLPMLIQLPILFALYAVIVNPLTHIAGFNKTAISNVTSAVTEVNEMLEATGNKTLRELKATTGRGDQIGIINQAIELNGENATVIVDGEGKILAYVKDGKYVTTKDEEVQVSFESAAKTEASVEIKDETVVGDNAESEQADGAEIEEAEDISVASQVPATEVGEPAETTPVSEEPQENIINVDGVNVREVTVSGIFNEKLRTKDSESDWNKRIDEITDIKSSFKVFGIDLSKNCDFSLPLIIIPILTFIFSFFSSKIIRKFTYQPQAANADPSQKASMGMMDWMMPLLSVYIAFQLAAAIAVYWIFQNILSAVQQILLFKLYPIPPVTEEMIKEAELQLKGKNKKNKQVVLSDDDYDDYDKTVVTDKSSNNRKKSGIISSRKSGKINPKVRKIYKQGRHLTAKKKI